MADDDLKSTLAGTPIRKLNLGDTKLRRAIIRVGFDSLVDVLELPEKEVDELFDLTYADAIVAMQEKYQKDPDAFAASILKQEVNDESTDSVLEKHAADVKAARRTAPPVQRTSYIGEGPRTLPPTPFSNVLRDFERRAKEAFDDLDDRYEDVMAYQAFDEFSTELDDISKAFESLFRFYSSEPRAALSLIDRLLRNVFIVYVADRARAVYKEGNLWGNFFAGLNMPEGSVQSTFKQVFVGQIERRKMPLYAREEEANYYFYTALLHGGLSGDAWSNLWQKSLLPLAQEIAKGHYGFGGEMDGHAILKEIKNPDSRFAPKKTVLNILEKAPDTTIAPLFDASMRVAAQIETARKDAVEYTMLSNYGLPDVAMQALRDNQEEKKPGSASGRRARSTDGDRETRIVYLPMASLQLDLATGTVCMKWPKQQFPLHFVDHRIDYYIDGSLVLTQPFKIGVGKCLLDPVEISVGPQSRYDVELRLVEVVDDEAEEKSSLQQTFTRSKPGCFEFVKDIRGIFRLRGRNERITKKRRIAYMVKTGLRIEPGLGMKAVYEYGTGGEWDAAQIFVFDVEPGASGSIVDGATGAEIAIWQERYSAKIDKRRIIGETAEGLDLYGYAPCELGTNGGLPSVSIEALDGLTALDDLEIVCMCDGKRVSMPRRVLWSDEYGECSSAQIALVPKESSMFDWHIETCEIEARQKSAGGKAVFRYRFAVVPIRGFRLEGVSFDYGMAVADYVFQPMLAVDIVDSRGEAEQIGAWGRYSARTLLKDEFLCLSIKSVDYGKQTDAKLALAALDVVVPDTLGEIAKTRPICLADALALGPSEGNFKVTAYGWRYNRAVVAFLGYVPMIFKELKKPGTHEFNVFRHASEFVQANDSVPSDKPLRLSIVYGDDVSEGYLKPAWTNVELVRCREGVGIDGWKVLMKADGTHVIRFDGAPLCDLRLDFRRKIGGKVIGGVSVEAGAEEAELPNLVVKQLDARKKLLMTVAPTSWFGEPEYEYSVEFTFERQ
ncbi:MAG: hypothetical protein IJI68_08725 [Eggerthellaceae bacterium]|nr:hypothetical protein [Eggerthellaceae bacterium]